MGKRKEVFYRLRPRPDGKPKVPPPEEQNRIRRAVKADQRAKKGKKQRRMTVPR